LRDIKIPQNAIIGVITRDKDVLVPVGDTVLYPGDKVIIFALPKAISAVDKMFGKK
jgi:trk system potassium uptake protein TrkA